MPSRNLIIPLILCLALGGCAVGPDYARPGAAEPQTYKEASPNAAVAAADWRPAAPGAPDAGPWWRTFADPELNALMLELGRNNQNIQAALASLRQALAQVREARSAFFPTLGLSGGASRGVSGSGGTSGSDWGNDSPSNSYSAVLQASWEPDIWGGTRRNVEGSEAQAQAQAANLGAVILSMRGELALNYFQARSYDAMLDLYDQTVEAYTRALAITENQYLAGVATRADVATAQAQLKNAQAQAASLDLQRRQTEHAIAILLGRAPARFSLPHGPITAKLPVVDAGLPAGLLERRPDVAMAERQAAAANANIGVAQSAFFPAFSFPATLGYASSAWAHWISAPNEIWSLGVSLAQTLFQGGALLARKDQAVAAWEYATANYRQTALQAFADVEDALASARLLKTQEQLQREAAAASAEAARIMLNQYKAGVITYIDVATAQANALNDARSVEQLKGQRFAAAVTLIRALGGGWDESRLAAAGEAPPPDSHPAKEVAQP